MRQDDRLRLWAGAIIITVLFAAVIAVLWIWWPDCIQC